MIMISAAFLAFTGIWLGMSAETDPAVATDVHPAPAIPDTLLRVAQAVVEGTCQRCHNADRMRGNMSLEGFQVASAEEHGAIAERMVRKLRAGMMPPVGTRRPGGDSLEVLVEALEIRLDDMATGAINPGRRTFQRLNRAEYTASVRDLLDLEIDAADYLPADTKSANFDNIADVQLLSPTLMDAYLRAASDISRLAVGDASAGASEATYRVSRWVSQLHQVEGAPYGTRGGLSVVHTFPADGAYRFRVSFHHETTGALFGNGKGALHTEERPEEIELSVDGARVALLEVPRWMHVSDEDGVNLRTEPIAISAGPHRVSAAFIRRFEGPLQDLISPHEWSIASTSITDAYGFTTLPHLRDMAITGPFDPTGVSPTPSRARIFGCYPESADGARPCAEEILARLGSRAYRRPLTPENLSAVMALYDDGATDGGFEAGVRLALEGLLASPHFVFRFEEPPAARIAAAQGSEESSDYEISDFDLASRLSFFLWGQGPDDRLADLAGRGELSSSDVLESEVRRMLEDRRSEALATRFAAQWFRLADLEPLHPDVRTYPDFDQQLKDAMSRETELFFRELVSHDRPVLELLTADYTYVNERLARHYDLSGVAGDHFRRVRQVDDERRGILGHGSVLTLTSHAGRTSPVLRGKWVMEVLLGTPPPPPPPDIPDLEATAEAEDGRFRSVRERLEEHRRSPACRSCHRVIDPIGMALEHFDATGARRLRDAGVPVDAASEYYDGTTVESANDLRAALLARPMPLLRTFTENLLAYALGRRVEYYDMPTVRAIVRGAAAEDHRISAYILGVVNSPAFRMKAADPATQETTSH